MELGKYVDGRPLNYDEATKQFDVGGAPVTLAEVVAYDRAGQLDWLSDELRSWAQDIATNQSAQTSDTHSSTTDAVAPGGTGLFGFRSRSPWKMGIASLYYVFAVATSIGLLVTRKPYATNGSDIAVELLSGLLLSLVLLSPAFLLSDFGYRDRLPLFKRRKFAWSALGMALFFVVMLVTSAVADTLHTQPYKVAEAAERAAQEQEAVELQAEADAKDAANAKLKAEEDAKKAAAAKRQAEADAKRAAEKEAQSAADASATTEAKRQEQAAAKAEAAKATTPTEPKNPIISMGQVVTVGKFEYVVNSTASTKELGTAPFNQTTNDEYLLVNLSIKNKDSESRMMDASMFEIIDTAGNVYQPDSGAVIYLDASFFLEDVNPGLTRTGDIVFEIPEGLSGLSLRVRSGVGFAAGTSEVIKLDR